MTTTTEIQNTIRAAYAPTADQVREVTAKDSTEAIGFTFRMGSLFGATDTQGRVLVSCYMNRGAATMYLRKNAAKLTAAPAAEVAEAPATEQPAPAAAEVPTEEQPVAEVPAEDAPVWRYTVRPTVGTDAFEVVNPSGLVVERGFSTAAYAQEQADYLTALETRKRAVDALTPAQAALYAVIRRDGAVRSGLGYSLRVARRLAEVKLVTVAEVGAGSWTATHRDGLEHFTPAAPAEVGAAAEAGPAGVLPEDVAHPVAVAALAALEGQPLAAVVDADDLGGATGYWVQPCGDTGRVAVRWLEDGRPTVGADQRPPRARLRTATTLFETTPGWVVERGGNLQLMVWHMPTREAAEAAAPEVGLGAQAADADHPVVQAALEVLEGEQLAEVRKVIGPEANGWYVRPTPFGPDGQVTVWWVTDGRMRYGYPAERDRLRARAGRLFAEAGWTPARGSAVVQVFQSPVPAAAAPGA